MFQFLIGRLKTQVFLFVFFRHSEFQFLIGRLKTFIYRGEIDVKNSFQFLIGRLKTFQKKLDFLYKIVVSIPHR